MSEQKNTHTSKADPKPVPVTTSEKPAPEKPALPSYIQDMPELPSGASVFVLTPTDELERRATQALLEDGLYKYFEKQPTESNQLKVARLPHGSLLFVAHCVSDRAKRDDGTFGPVKKLHIGGPIELKDYTSSSADGYTWETDLGRVVDAVTAAAKHTNGVVWLGGLSGDPVKDQKVVKLIKS